MKTNNTLQDTMLDMLNNKIKQRRALHENRNQDDDITEVSTKVHIITDKKKHNNTEKWSQNNRVRIANEHKPTTKTERCKSY